MDSESSFGVLSITHKRQWTNRLRKLKVYVDQQESASIASGETVVIEVAEGHHELFIRVDWARSNINLFEIRAEETINFECGSKIEGWKLVLALFMALRRESLYLRQVSK